MQNRPFTSRTHPQHTHRKSNRGTIAQGGQPSSYIYISLYIYILYILYLRIWKSNPRCTDTACLQLRRVGGKKKKSHALAGVGPTAKSSGACGLLLFGVLWGSQQMVARAGRGGGGQIAGAWVDGPTKRKQAGEEEKFSLFPRAKERRAGSAGGGGVRKKEGRREATRLRVLSSAAGRYRAPHVFACLRQQVCACLGQQNCPRSCY